MMPRELDVQSRGVSGALSLSHGNSKGGKITNDRSSNITAQRRTQCYSTGRRWLYVRGSRGVERWLLQQLTRPRFLECDPNDRGYAGAQEGMRTVVSQKGGKDEEEFQHQYLKKISTHIDTFCNRTASVFCELCLEAPSIVHKAGTAQSGAAMHSGQADSRVSTSPPPSDLSLPHRSDTVES
jgi:hypothetical protein